MKLDELIPIYDKMQKNMERENLILFIMEAV